jgi:hypothetical protein
LATQITDEPPGAGEKYAVCIRSAAARRVGKVKTMDP